MVLVAPAAMDADVKIGPWAVWLAEVTSEMSQEFIVPLDMKVKTTTSAWFRTSPVGG